MATTVRYPAESLGSGCLSRWSDRGLPHVLHRRELSVNHRPVRAIRSVYGRPEWVEDLDIVNELKGHSGCVNALSWSKSGKLLASGSDDKHLNIYEYQPEDSKTQFKLATQVATGHTANIFSVKFMPHSNDQTVITCAGDSEIRIFDLGADRTSNTFDSMRFLSDSNTNCRVYRSHGDRVKRIVTESSPYLFLSCSEDGEVRQWDLRLPSSAYPRRRRDGSNSVPPPLISYKDHQIDLHTISCSPSQPYYIALGGSHLHCFLHDRRMLGRDRRKESGQGWRANTIDDGHDLEGKATRCVRRFAPGGKKKMGRSDNGHITACKISDAHPNELIVSWSGEHIYSFDITRSPDVKEMLTQRSIPKQMEGAGHKRKRMVASSSTSLSHQGGQRAESRPRTTSSESRVEEIALRVQYGNGQTEDISVRPQRERQDHGDLDQSSAYGIAANVIKIVARSLSPWSVDSGSVFTEILGDCASTLPRMRDIATTWAYPVNPSAQDLISQTRLRSTRESATRFVQAAGLISRLMGAQLAGPSSSSSAMSMFDQINISTTHRFELPASERFCYDFIKAICLWLDSGVGALLHGFSRESAPNARLASRFPVPPDADAEAVEEHLIPYLQSMASDKPIQNLNKTRSALDGNLNAFESEIAAVEEFAAALQKPFSDLSSSDDQEAADSQSRPQAMLYWVGIVARGVLANAWADLDYRGISMAFGEAGTPTEEVTRLERQIRSQVKHGEDEGLLNATDTAVQVHGGEYDGIDNESNEDEQQNSVHQDEDDENDDENEDDDENEGDEDEDELETDEDDEDDEGHNLGLLGRLQHSRHDRRRLWATVESDVPCLSHTRSYQGHCNVQTVKDVNFYGLDDEYVVSGSDDGNLFIWDRKTSKVITILEGDGEVVNVIQGHPYEPMLAVSGIDDTIKIFSPDARARHAARLGESVTAADTSAFSSISWLRRNRGRATGQPTASSAAQTDLPTEGTAGNTLSQSPEEDEDYVAPSGLASRKRIDQAYQIMNENDRSRENGNQESFITRRMLAQLASSIRRQRAEDDQVLNVDIADGEDDPQQRIALPDDCMVQ